MATVMDWVGHDEMKMVMYYYSLRDTSAREAMRRLNNSVAPLEGDISMSGECYGRQQ